MEDILSAVEEGNISQLTEHLQNGSKENELLKVIESRLQKGKGDPVSLIKTVLQASSTNSSADSKRCVVIYKYCVSILEKSELSNKLASDLVGLLMIQADSLTGTSMAEIANVFVDMTKNGSIQSGKGLELLPKILSALSTEETVVYGESRMNGVDYKGHVLNSLCSCRWNPQSVIHLAAMFKDITMTTEELKFVIEKIVRMISELQLSDLPALVYQLLLLSTKGHRRLVLEGITNFFMSQDTLQRGKSTMECSEDLLEGEDCSKETLRHTEGTIILHINFAIKQDQELGRELLKFLKGNQQSNSAILLAPFNLALSLSLSRIHRFEDQIFDLIKTTILKSFKDNEKQQQSSWVREVVPDTCPLEEFVLETVQNSVYGWDHVIQGLVQLGFLLMDSFGPKAMFGRVDTTSVQSGPTHQACQLGSKILLNTFKAHEMVREEILEQIFNRVVTKATSPVVHYLELLASSVLSAPQMLLESSAKIRETFDYLSFLSPGSAEELLRAIQPLLKLSLSLKDSLILVLKKAMFSRQLDSRKIGVSGFLMILKHFRVLGGLPVSQPSQAFSSSQVHVDVHARYNPSNNEALCLEIMGNLRRVLTQQADVRLLFYQGIYDALCRNTQLQSTVLENLLNQIKKYYEPAQDVNPPLKLELCISAQGDQVYLTEPMAHLLCCIQLCLIKVSEIKRRRHSDNDDDDEEESSLCHDELEEIMKSIVRRMVKSDMEDFELDKAADYSLGNSVGVKNNIFAILILGTYETLMEYTFNTGQNSASSFEEILQLYENYRKLYDVLKEKSNAAAGKKGKASTGKAPVSMMSLNCVRSVLTALIGEVPAAEEQDLAVLQENADFRKYAVTVALQKIQQIQEKGSCDGAEGGDKNKILNHICSIARLFIKHYTENQRPEQRKNRAKNICGQCLEGVVSVMTILTQRYANQLTKCLCDIADTDEEEDAQSVIYSHIRNYQKLVMNILTSQDEDRSMKEVTSLLNVIQLLYKQLLPSSGQYEKVHSWIEKLCTEQSIDDIATCKLLFIMLLELTHQVKSCPPLLRNLSQDIHSQIGDTDEEVEVEDKTHFALVTHRTAAPMLIMLVLQQFERELDDTEWVLSRLKAEIPVQAPSYFFLFPNFKKDIYGRHFQSDKEVVSAVEKLFSADSEVDLTQREGHEKSICTRVGILVTAFHELLQTSIPVGMCMEGIVKQVTRLYGTLTLLVKYYLQLYQQRAGHLSGRFEKLIKLTGTHLTQHCYAMITYIQKTESEQMQQNVDKGKKDKKKQTAAFMAGRAKAMKESRTIPNLIFAIETFEKFLIQLTKKSKVNLMEHMKLSTSRDFRINLASVQAAMDDDDEEEEDSDDEDANESRQTQEQEDKSESEGEKEEQENKAPSNKRQRADDADTSVPAKKSKVNVKGKAVHKTK